MFYGIIILSRRGAPPVAAPHLPGADRAGMD